MYARQYAHIGHNVKISKISKISDIYIYIYIYIYQKYHDIFYIFDIWYFRKYHDIFHILHAKWQNTKTASMLINLLHLLIQWSISGLFLAFLFLHIMRDQSLMLRCATKILYTYAAEHRCRHRFHQRILQVKILESEFGRWFLKEIRSSWLNMFPVVTTTGY